MKRECSLIPWLRGLARLGIVAGYLASGGCGSEALGTGGTAATSAKTATEPSAKAAPPAKGKSRRPVIDTTSRQELHRRRAAERKSLAAQ